MRKLIEKMSFTVIVFSLLMAFAAIGSVRAWAQVATMPLDDPNCGGRCQSTLDCPDGDECYCSGPSGYGSCVIDVS
jgi:hypothetical protein